MKCSWPRFAATVTVLASLLLGGCKSSSSPYQYDPLRVDSAPAMSSSAPMVPVSGNASTATTPVAAVSAAPRSVDPTSTLLYVGNTLTVAFSDLVTPIPPIDDVIKEDGSIVLIYNQTFQAAGKTVGALQSEIRDRYVPKFFRYLTVSIKTAERFYSVGGEVHSANRQVYSGRMTVLGAIDTAGGFGEFANKTSVLLIRASGKKYYVNCKRALEHPELNLEVYPGDSIFVKKRIW